MAVQQSWHLAYKNREMTQVAKPQSSTKVRWRPKKNHENIMTVSMEKTWAYKVAMLSTYLKTTVGGEDAAQCQ